MKNFPLYFQRQSLVYILVVVNLFSSFPFLLATGPQQNYFIKEGYISRISNSQFDDTGNQDHFQDEVYFAAHKLAKYYHFTKIGDIGCGSGFKLMKYFNKFKTIGFEIPPTLNFLINKYPNRQWELSDLTKYPDDRQFDLIICSDVIEHFVEPDKLLEWLQGFDFKLLVISTPDRDRLLSIQNNPQSQTGPPVNPAHIREWSYDEFTSFIGQYFDIRSHFHTKNEYWGQVVVAKKRK